MSSALYPSNDEIRRALDELSKKYLISEDASYVMLLFDSNPFSGKEILHILTSKKTNEFSEPDRKIVKILAYNFGI
ncbi:hypothetical protein Q0601_07565 [Paracoccus onubensis]|nr:hypothetical protein [Paracoccus onubensis]